MRVDRSIVKIIRKLFSKGEIFETLITYNLVVSLKKYLNVVEELNSNEIDV